MNQTHAKPIVAEWIRERAIAHRGLHDLNEKVWENTLTAMQRAIDAGYAIETDLQLSSDRKAMLFHDYELNRLTGEVGNTRKKTAAELSSMTVGGTADRIPELSKLLQLVDGKVGLVLELKGQSGADTGFIEAIANALAAYDDGTGYHGPVAIMSFNHDLLRDARHIAPHLILGLTAEGDEKTWDMHQAIVEECDVDFISYHVDELDNPFVAGFRASGRPVISWTIRTPEQLAISRRFGDQPTFEGFLPSIS